MRRARNNQSGSFGIASLDMFSGLFGLLILLYVQTERYGGTNPLDSDDLQYIEIIAPVGFEGELGLSFTIGLNQILSLPNCPKKANVMWVTCLPNNIMVVTDGVKIETPIHIFMTSSKLPLSELTDTINIKLNSTTGSRTVQLQKSQNYMAEIR